MAPLPPSGPIEISSVWLWFAWAEERKNASDSPRASAEKLANASLPDRVMRVIVLPPNLFGV
jgi:hypothetical protein